MQSSQSYAKSPQEKKAKALNVDMNSQGNTFLKKKSSSPAVNVKKHKIQLVSKSIDSSLISALNVQEQNAQAQIQSQQIQQQQKQMQQSSKKTITTHNTRHPKNLRAHVSNSPPKSPMYSPKSKFISSLENFKPKRFANEIKKIQNNAMTKAFENVKNSLGNNKQSSNNLSEVSKSENFSAFDNHQFNKQIHQPKSLLSEKELIPWQPILKDYSIEKVVGMGTFGVVAKGFSFYLNKNVAIKRIENFAKNEYHCLQLIREIKLLKELNEHPDGLKYVPQLLDLIVSGKNAGDPKCEQQDDMTVFIVMEYFEYDLKRVICNHVKTFDENQIVTLIFDLLSTVKFLHQLNVVHRDIKPSNFFVTSDMRVKIGDFGIARSLPENLSGKGSGNTTRVRNSIRKSRFDPDFLQDDMRQIFLQKMQHIVDGASKKNRSISNLVGSRWYRAPEVSLLQKQYDQAQDMWSMGCVIFEILQAAFPAPDQPRKRVLFPGDSCFPLSVKATNEDQKDNGNCKAMNVSEKDQIRVIIKQINHLDELDVSYIDTKDVHQYLKQIQDIEKPSQKDYFINRLHGVPKGLETILKNLIQFNPYIRWSAKECLCEEIFQEFGLKQQLYAIMIKDDGMKGTSKILLEVDRDGVFNYETAVSDKFYRMDYIRMILDEQKNISIMNIMQKDSLTAGSSCLGPDSLSDECDGKQIKPKMGQIGENNQV